MWKTERDPVQHGGRLVDSRKAGRSCQAGSDASRSGGRGQESGGFCASSLRIRLSTRWIKIFMPETRAIELWEKRSAKPSRRRCGAIPRVFICGEDIAEAGTVFKVLSGLVDEFGKERVLDTPISEPGFTGIAVGAAMTGLRPVVDIMFGDFSTLIMDQMVNQAAKVHYMSGGKWKVPMVMRADARRLAPFCCTAFAVVACVVLSYSRAESRPAIDALRCQGPYEDRHSRRQSCVFFEDKMMYKLKGPVPDGRLHDSVWRCGCQA